MWGGTGLQQADAVAVDAQGNSWIVGYTDTEDLPTTSNPPFPRGGGVDAFIVKLDPNANLLLSTYLGGDGDDRASAVGVDSAGNVYVAGTTTSNSIAGRSLIGRSLQADGFVIKLDPTARTILYAVAIGGSSDDLIHGMAVRPDGTVFVAGETNSPDFPMKGAPQATLRGVTNAFVAKLNSDGVIVYSTYLGGSASDVAEAIAVDGNGVAWVAGSTTSRDFPLVSPLQTQLSGSQKPFIVRLATDGASLLMSTYFGGSGGQAGLPEMATAVAVDFTGDAYIAGVTSSSDFPLVSPWQRQFMGWDSDGFLVSFTPAGAVRFSTYFGGSAFDLVSSLVVMGDGRILAGGYTLSADLPITNGATAWQPGGYNGFAAVFDSLATSVSYATYLNQGSSNSILAVAGVTAPVAVGVSAPLNQPGVTLATAAQLTIPAQGCILNPTSVALGATSGGGSVGVTCPSGYAWTTSSNAPWLSVVSGGSGSGSGTIAYAVGANSSTSSRSAALTIGGQAFSVSQAGAALLGITKTHTGSFKRGQNGATYTMTVSNSVQAGPTAGTVTVTDSAPTGITVSSMSGTGWSCSGNTCSRSDVLAAGSSYPVIIVSVRVASNAPGQLTNQVNVSGGGSQSVAASDITSVTPLSAGDFNADGHPDLIWQNDATREATVWYMGGTAGTTLLGWSYLSGSMAGWKVVGVGDFDGDGHPDLVWQNDTTRQATVWYMGGAQGTTLLSWSYLSGSVPGWTIVGVADLDQDGHPDLVWLNDTTRQATVWYMGGAQGTTMLGWSYLSGSVPGWRIVGIKDFDGDGHPDLIWQSDTTRQATVWYMVGSQGTTMLSWSYLSGSVPGWTIVAVADFDQDGHPDLVWLNDTTRQATAWYMGGTGGATMREWSYLSGSVAGWTIAGPR